MKVAAVETLKAFDDHRRKVAAEKALAAAEEARAAVSDPIELLLAAGETMAVNDADERAELVAYSTLSRSELNLFAKLHRSIRLEDDEDARFGGFEAVRPVPVATCCSSPPTTSVSRGRRRTRPTTPSPRARHAPSSPHR